MVGDQLRKIQVDQRIGIDHDEGAVFDRMICTFVNAPAFAGRWNNQAKQMNSAMNTAK